MTAQEQFAASVKQRINGDKNHGWGVDDSTEVILAVIANETGTTRNDLDGVANIIKGLVNPSAFRQQLENNGILNKGEKRTNKGLASLLDGLK